MSRLHLDRARHSHYTRVSKLLPMKDYLASRSIQNNHPDMLLYLTYILDCEHKKTTGLHLPKNLDGILMPAQYPGLDKFIDDEIDNYLTTYCER
jgi:hypothetical protein